MESLITVEKEEEGKRLDKLLADRFPDYSRTYFQYLIESSLVLLNGKIVKKRELPQEGDEIDIAFQVTPEISLEPENIPLNILYEEEELIIINKPLGMVIHPGAGNPSHTFVNALLYHCRCEIQGGVRPGIVHRLDKETSGVLMAAKSLRMQEKLVALFAAREIDKKYIAICIGNPKERDIVTQIGRHPIKRKEMAVLQEGGKEAITHVKTLHFDGTFSTVDLTLKTGRTHQLRVHLKHIGTPILGDPIYGNPHLNKKYQIERTLLHASEIAFYHPYTQERITVKAPFPPDFKKFFPIEN